MEIEKLKFVLKGRDGCSYTTHKELEQADKEWKQRNNFYIVYDAQLGERTIAPGTGKVRICVGHFLELDLVTGGYIGVPAYKEKTF